MTFGDMARVICGRQAAKYLLHLAGRPQMILMIEPDISTSKGSHLPNAIKDKLARYLQRHRYGAAVYPI